MESTNSTVKKKVKTSASVKNRYNAKTYDRIEIVVPKGRKDIIKSLADAAGESTNSYIVTALNKRMAATPIHNIGTSQRLNALDKFFTTIESSNEEIPETFERVSFNRGLDL